MRFFRTTKLKNKLTIKKKQKTIMFNKINKNKKKKNYYKLANRLLLANFKIIIPVRALKGFNKKKISQKNKLKKKIAFLNRIFVNSLTKIKITSTI